jgi:hypothetical protein
MNSLRVEREGRRILSGTTLQRAIADGVTLDQASLRGGEVIAVDRRSNVTWTDGLRLVSVMVSIAVGLYGLSRAF